MPGIGYLIAMLTAAAFACPFCGPTPPTLAERLAEADVGVFAEWRKLVEPTDAMSDPQTKFRIVEVLRATDKPPEKGSVVSVPIHWDGQPGDLVLLLGRRTDGITEWNQPIEISEVSAAYVRQSPSPEKPQSERLPFFLRFLESMDPLLANDAFAEFSRAKYEDVVTIKDRLPREKLRKWLDDPMTAPNRYGFYGLLLGLCGKPDDAEYLAGRVFPATPEDKFVFGLDGMMAGYVLLAGEPGFQRLITKKLADPMTPDGDVFAVINLARFLWQFAPDRVPREKVAASLRPLVEQPKFAEVVIVDLARWKDWTVLPAVIKRYGQDPFETDTAKLKVIQFALVCVKHGGSDPAVKTAQQFLDRLQAENADLVQQARRALSLPTAPSP